MKVLYWKKMSSRTFINQEEMTASGFKAFKDHRTLLLGSNAVGNLKLKPMLIYHSENPHPLKGNIKEKTLLSSGRLTRWDGWWCYLEICHLLFDAHATWLCSYQQLGQSLPAGHWQCTKPWLTIFMLFLPLNTTTLIQPIDQSVIATFKAFFCTEQCNISWMQLIEKVGQQ